MLSCRIISSAGPRQSVVRNIVSEELGRTMEATQALAEINSVVNYKAQVRCLRRVVFCGRASRQMQCGYGVFTP